MELSIIVPCYNCVRTLKATVESIQASGLPEYEIILIDDGSTDGTAALCGLLCERYAEIRCIHQENAGVSAARNRGINEAQGDYIWFVDADDTVDAEALAHAAQLAAAQQPDMLIFGMSFDYYHKGICYRREELVPPCEGMLLLPQLRQRFPAFYDCNALTTACNKFCRRALIVRAGVRFHEDMILMEDYLFVLELLPHCETICCLQEAVYRYRQAEDEKGAYRRLQRIPDLAAYIKPFEQSIEKLGIPDKDKLTDSFYWMLLQQKMQYSGLKDIRRTIDIHKSGVRANMNRKLDPMKIYLTNRKILLRHRLAVAVKSGKLYQRYNVRRDG